MPKTLKGIYENGEVRLSESPQINISKSNVIITFIGFQKNKLKGNVKEVLNTLENYRGILTDKFTKKTSLDYVNEIRDKNNQEWEERLRRIGIK